VVEGQVVDERGDPVAGARVARDHVPTWLVVGTSPLGVALSDAKGRFTLRELPEGNLVLEAYAPDRGRALAEGVRVTAGRTTVNVRIVLGARSADQAPAPESMATGSVAVTLGETGEPVEVVIVSLVEGSEAERAGLAPGDVLLAVDGASVATMSEARARLSGPLADDVVLRVRRGEQTLALRVARESVRR
jgi:S1-C subfamily serine protease